MQRDEYHFLLMFKRIFLNPFFVYKYENVEKLQSFFCCFLAQKKKLYKRLKRGEKSLNNKNNKKQFKAYLALMNDDDER